MTTEGEIRQRAYDIWVAEGRPASSALDDWYQAKEEVAAYKALGSANYTAVQHGSVVTVTASGVLPRGGMRASLEDDRLEPNDPDFPGVFLSYMLLFRQCGSFGDIGPVPFETSAQFEYRGSVFEVVIFDRHGPHRLAVSQG
jgi:hypothetical protein